MPVSDFALEAIAPGIGFFALNSAYEPFSVGSHESLGHKISRCPGAGQCGIQSGGDSGHITAQKREMHIESTNIASMRAAGKNGSGNARPEKVDPGIQSPDAQKAGKQSQPFVCLCARFCRT